MLDLRERNARMCTLYTEGWTHARIGDEFNLSVVRVGQILRGAGLRKVDRARTPRPTAFIGTHVSNGIKESLRREAENDGISLSLFVAQTMRAELIRRGCAINDTLSFKEIDVPLPLEG